VCVVDGEPVEMWYRNIFTDEIALKAQRLLLTTVVDAFKSHPAVGVWNLGNEPDLFAIAPDRETGAAWVREMTALIRQHDAVHPVTCGLHVESLRTAEALRVDDTFGAVDWPVMHGYPMYVDWIDDPLDARFVPYLCALTSALSGGKPTLAEEFGGCTAAPGQPSEIWAWHSYGTDRTQFMASEDDFAAYIADVLPNLLRVGSTGAVLWCWADYDESIWHQPPLMESKHERHFGLVRPDGTLKPHAEVLRQFAATNPTVQSPTWTLPLDISPDAFYADPARHFQRLYAVFLQAQP